MSFEEIKSKGIECQTKFWTPIVIVNRSKDFDAEGWCYCARNIAGVQVCYSWFRFGDIWFPISADLDGIIKKIQALPVRDRRLKEGRE
jgi:hypothetical protein